ncbi:MAG: hypothetical protein SGJ17_00235 [Hyphomicrobiales bacterium]|nr:hypothetical protein [Hyphomicrobiales bacterium]
MTVTYQIVEHNDGWAYMLGDVYSQTFATEQEAQAGADDAASRQQLNGETTDIEYQDATGELQREFAAGDDRPDAEVVALKQD